MGHAIATVYTSFGAASDAPGVGYTAEPALADLNARIQAKYQVPFNAMVSAAGWERVPGLTPIDWTTLSYTVPTNSVTTPVLGRDWFRFTDADSAAMPIFFTITYQLTRRGASPWAYALSVLVTLSTQLGSDGTPAGSLVSRSFIGAGSNGSTAWGLLSNTEYTFNAVMQDGFLALRAGEPSAFSGWTGCVAAERFRTLLGESQAVDRGAVLFGRGYPSEATATSFAGFVSADTSQQIINTVTTNFGVLAMPPTRYSSSAEGLTVPVFPFLISTPAVRGSRNVLGGLPDDFMGSVEAMLPLPGGGYGNFRSFGLAGDNLGIGGQGRLLVRWE